MLVGATIAFIRDIVPGHGYHPPLIGDCPRYHIPHFLKVNHREHRGSPSMAAGTYTKATREVCAPACGLHHSPKCKYLGWQPAATRSMSGGVPHSEGMYRTSDRGFGTAVFWRVLRVRGIFAFCYLRNPLACHSFAVTQLSTSIQRKKDFTTFCLIYFEFRRKIHQIFSLLCWHRNTRDRDPLISAQPRLAPISAVPVRFCILNQQYSKSSRFDLKHYQFTDASFNCGPYF